MKLENFVLFSLAPVSRASRALLYGVLFVFVTGVFSACGEYNKVLKSEDPAYKYEKAVEYYNDGRCMQALPIFEDLIGMVRGTQLAEGVYYHYAQCHYCIGDYYLANYYFNNFTKTFVYSSYAEECQFLAAMCSYNLSPQQSLDQTDTRLAINEMQLFMDRYPSSAKRDTCNLLITELNQKLERKSFEIARLYEKTQHYKSAVLALNSAIKEYPNSPYKEEMLFLIVRANYLYANRSVVEMKLERFNNTIESYYNFVAYFPESKFLKEAEGYFVNSRKEVERLQKTAS
jgi:outer membrane protein assembly factor BamD